MIILSHVNLDKSELDLCAWRYLTFSKFISLITYRALWFPKLNILRDQYEGSLPARTEAQMHQNNQKWKSKFTSSEHQKQIDAWPSDNVNDGRELTIVNCWFIDTIESKRMWDEYVGSSEGVAIRSTIRKLATYVYAYPEWSHIGKVKYVDLQSYGMTTYKGSQAHERAFLKDKEKYSHEQEVRLTSMSIKSPGCAGMDGKPLTKEDYTGKNMNNFENPGLYIGVELKKLMDSIVLAPNAPKWFELLVKRIVALSGLDCGVERSQTENNSKGHLQA